MNKLQKLISGALATLAAATMTIVIATGRDGASLLRAEQQYSYTCNDIVFTETVNNPGKYADVDDVSTIATTTVDCSMTEWTNANYGVKGATAIKIGGSKTGKYDGSVKLTLNNLITTKVIIYAAEWLKDPATAALTVNGISVTLPTTPEGSSYSFIPYTFEFAPTNELTFTNGSGNGGKRRIVISKIVLKLFASSSN